MRMQKINDGAKGLFKDAAAKSKCECMERHFPVHKPIHLRMDQNLQLPREEGVRVLQLQDRRRIYTGRVYIDKILFIFYLFCNNFILFYYSSFPLLFLRSRFALSSSVNIILHYRYSRNLLSTSSFEKSPRHLVFLLIKI